MLIPRQSFKLEHFIYVETIWKNPRFHAFWVGRKLISWRSLGVPQSYYLINSPFTSHTETPFKKCIFLCRIVSFPFRVFLRKLAQNSNVCFAHFVPNWHAIAWKGVSFALGWNTKSRYYLYAVVSKSKRYSRYVSRDNPSIFWLLFTA